jgi:hypothetical protein
MITAKHKALRLSRSLTEGFPGTKSSLPTISVFFAQPPVALRVYVTYVEPRFDSPVMAHGIAQESLHAQTKLPLPGSVPEAFHVLGFPHIVVAILLRN